MDINEMFYRNDWYYCKSKRIRIGDAEHRAGVSQGYLSRVTNRDSGRGRRVTLEIAAAFAKILGVTVDDLITLDLARERRIQLLEAELEQLKQSRAGGR